jgi:glutamate-1-semialdehyde 2,1-aminomutase
VPLKVTWAPGLLTLFFKDGELTNLDDVRGCDMDAHAAFCREMLELGIYLPPSQYEAWFPSLAHTEEHVERTLEAARKALS